MGEGYERHGLSRYGMRDFFVQGEYGIRNSRIYDGIGGLYRRQMVDWWCDGVVVWWCGGVMAWWCGGVVVWSGVGVVVCWWVLVSLYCCFVYDNGA